MRCAKRIVIKMSNKQKKINRKNHAQSASIKPITPQNLIDPRENAVDAKGGMWYTYGTKYDYVINNVPSGQDSVSSVYHRNHPFDIPLIYERI